MGNVVSCSNSFSWDFNQELRYILCPKRQVETLRRRTDGLKTTKDAIWREVDEMVRQRNGVIMHPQVGIWMDSVDGLVAEVDTITTSKGDLAFLRRLCCCYSRYELGEQIYQMLDEITRLEGQHKEILQCLVMDVRPVIDLQRKLEDEMEQLRATKMDLERRVLGLERAAVDPPMVRSEHMNLWIRNVNSIDTEVSNLIANIESATPHVWATSRGELQVNIQRMRGKIKDLSEETERLEKNGLVEMAPLERIHELPGPLEDIVVGIDEKMKEVLGLLDDDSIELIGIHGMGGVGKTTLVKEVTKKLRSLGDSSIELLVISVVVSRNLNIRKIQEEIVTQLGYPRGTSSHFQNEQDGAKFIWDKLCRKSFLLVLDDVWEPFDLSEIGFRSSSKQMEEEKKCKVVITSRSENACAGMVGSIRSREIRKVGFLREDHAWELFHKKIGNDFLESEEIRRLAKQIVRKCGGLPLVLKTVASAMAKNETKSDWVHAKSQLDHYSSDIREMEDIYERLRFSFDRLSEELKSCLLYCAMFPEDSDITIEQVIGYWIVEGFLEIKGPFDYNWLCWKARSYIIRRLQESSLLERGSRHKEDFKLRDAVRAMVFWLGNNGREGNEQYKLLNHAGEHRSSSIRVDESWVGVKMVSLMRNHIELLVPSNGISGEAMRVQTLLMDFNSLRHLPENLFPLLSSLLILNLSWTGLEEIPKSIGTLKLLRYLNLSRTSIKELPVEIGNLANLQFLNVSYTRNLRYIPQLAISPLKMLQFLYLYNCPSLKYEEKGKLKLVDLNGLPRLIDVALTIYHVGDAESVLQSSTLSMSTSGLCFANIHDVTIHTITECMKRLVSFRIEDYRFLSRELKLNGKDFSKLKNLDLSEIAGLRSIVLTSPMSCLQELNIVKCEFEHLTWLQQLPNLQNLSVSNCSCLRELLLKQESGDDNDESSYEPLLSHLEYMVLIGLPLLENISSDNMLFPSLTRIYVTKCSRLRKLPIKSCNSVSTTVQCKWDWWESLEWGDGECNRSRFKFIHLPGFGQGTIAAESKFHPTGTWEPTESTPDAFASLPFGYQLSRHFPRYEIFEERTNW